MTYSGSQRRNVLRRADCAPRARQPRGHLSLRRESADRGKNCRVERKKEEEEKEK